jgi:hypothetical protein
MIALVAMLILVLLDLVLAFIFIVGVLTGRGNNFLLGTVLGAEFLVLAAAIICYMWARIPPREVVEDWKGGLLW